MLPKVAKFVKNKEKVTKIKIVHPERQDTVIKMIAMHGACGASSSGQCAQQAIREIPQSRSLLVVSTQFLRNQGTKEYPIVGDEYNTNECQVTKDAISHWLLPCLGVFHLPFLCQRKFYTDLVVVSLQIKEAKTW